MQSSGYYIDRAKKALGFSADAALADYLEVRPQALNAMRRKGLSDPIALKIASAAGVDAGEVITIARAERERDPAVKSALAEFAKKVVAPAAGQPAALGRLPSFVERRKSGFSTGRVSALFRRAVRSVKNARRNSKSLATFSTHAGAPKLILFG